MYSYYLIIKGFQKLNKNEKEILLSLFSDIVSNPKIEIKDDYLIIIINEVKSLSWQEFIIGTNAELFSNLKLYESLLFINKKDLTTSINNKISDKLFKDEYNNEMTLLYNIVKEEINEKLKEDVFKALYKDKEFLRSVKVYLEENSNTSKAAKLCNMHRNTLINRLEKFTKETGFDLKNYNEAIFIYLLLKDL